MSENKGHKAEEDVEADTHQSHSRAGEDGKDGSYVGRMTGSDDTFDAGETGAEARSKDT